MSILDRFKNKKPAAEPLKADPDQDAPSSEGVSGTDSPAISADAPQDDLTRAAPSGAGAHPCTVSFQSRTEPDATGTRLVTLTGHDTHGQPFTFSGHEQRRTHDGAQHTTLTLHAGDTVPPDAAPDLIVEYHAQPGEPLAAPHVLSGNPALLFRLGLNTEPGA